MTLKLKPLSSDYCLPQYATDGSGCLDLFISKSYSKADWTPIYTATSIPIDDECQAISQTIVAYSLIIPLGYAVETPDEWTFDIYSRSGHGRKYNCSLANSVGIVDNDYRGEVQVMLQSLIPFDIDTSNGPVAIAQAALVHRPYVYVSVVDELSEPSQPHLGFGSTGGHCVQ